MCVGEGVVCVGVEGVVSVVCGELRGWRVCVRSWLVWCVVCVLTLSSFEPGQHVCGCVPGEGGNSRVNFKRHTTCIPVSWLSPAETAIV